MKAKTDAELIAEAEKLRSEWAGNYGPFGPDERFDMLTGIAIELARRLAAANEQLAHYRAHTRFYDLFHEHVKNENGGSMCEKDCDPSVGVHLCEICWPEGYDSCEDDVI